MLSVHIEMHVSSISHKTGRKHRRGFLFLLGCQTCPHRMLGARPRPQRFGFLWSGGGSSRRGIETFPACFAKAASGRHRAPLAPRCYHCPQPLLSQRCCDESPRGPRRCDPKSRALRSGGLDALGRLSANVSSYYRKRTAALDCSGATGLSQCL